MNSLHFVHYSAGQPSQTKTYYIDRKPYTISADGELLPEEKTPRPSNAWIIFRSHSLRDFKAADPNFRAPQGIISKMIADLWKTATPETKATYNDLARQCKIEHATKYPEYKLKPRPKKAMKKKYPTSRSLSISSTSSTESNNSSVLPSYSQQFNTISSSASSVFSSSSCQPPSPTYASFNLSPWNDSSPTFRPTTDDYYSSNWFIGLSPPFCDSLDVTESANWAFNDRQGWGPGHGGNGDVWSSGYEQQTSRLGNWEAL